VGVSSVWATSVAVYIVKSAILHGCVGILAIASYLVRLVCGSGSDLALLTRRELGEITVIVTLPIKRNRISPIIQVARQIWRVGETHIL
jgi:hypothetical protein